MIPGANAVSTLNAGLSYINKALSFAASTPTTVCLFLAPVASATDFRSKTFRCPLRAHFLLPFFDTFIAPIFFAEVSEADFLEPD